MRPYMNPQFLTEKAKLAGRVADLARERSMVDHPTHPADAKSIQVVLDEVGVAVADFVCTTPYNGLEILLQLEAMVGQTYEWMSNSGAIEQSLTAAARPQPSPVMERSFADFRKAWLEQADYEGSSNDQGLRLSNSVCDAAGVVFAAPCATAGDFIVKAYVNLLWHAGHTAGTHLGNGISGSPFDIDLVNIDSDSTVTDAYYGAVYDDLDHCDLGACLLATGSINFDARSWVERADTIGMPVSVIRKIDGSLSLSFGFIGVDDDRLRREESRLQRIMTFTPRGRWQSVAEFIVAHRPDLVFSAAVRADQAAA